MAKRGELKPMDAWEEGIREKAVAYNVVLFQPGSSSRVRGTVDSIESATQHGLELLAENSAARSVMIYAIDEFDHHALVGTIDRHSKTYKPVIAKRY